MALLRHAAVCTAAVLLAGCGAATAPISPPQESVAVHSVLAPGAKTAAVMLTRFDPDGGEARFQRVSGADVRLVRGADTLRLQEAPAGFRDCLADPLAPGEGEPVRPGCYAAAVPEGLRQGVRYELRISFAGGGTARGAVTIPAAPEILAPLPGRIVSVVTPQGPVQGSRDAFFPVRWTVPAGAGRIEIGIVRPQAYRDGRRLEGVECRLQQGPLPEDLARIDSVTHQVVGAFCARGPDVAAWDSITAQLVLTAYDTAYARYAREVLSAGSVRGSRASAGIEGAFGVFGAASSSERRLTLVPAK